MTKRHITRSVEFIVAGALEVEALPIGSELDAHSLDQAEQQLGRRLRITAKPDAPVTLKLHSVDERESTAAIFKNAIDECAGEEGVSIECDSFVLKCSGIVIQFPDSLVIRPSKVAETGSTGTAPGRGQVA